MSRRVYMDHSATTPVDPKVVEAMVPFFTEHYGNPNSLHGWGKEARSAMDRARGQVASLIGAEPKEIIFTGGGSEADNLAIKGAAWAMRDRGRHIITSAIEHHAVLDAFKWLGKNGFEVTVLPVDREGLVSPEDLRGAIRPDTTLVSIMFANNEIGTVQPIGELGGICRERGVLFHTDGVQAAGHMPLDVRSLPVDMLTMAAHKMYGPKGIGALYVRRGIKLTPLIHGGGQEFGLRSGTENVPLVVGFGMAAEMAAERLSKGEHEREAQLRDRLIEGVLSSVEDSFVTGSRTHRLPFHASFCIPRVEGEAMVLRLDFAGVAASSGSACTSGSLDPSHVLLSIGLPHELAHGSLRLTLGKDTTQEDVDHVLSVLPPIIKTLRDMSPYKKA
ncbi:cysteine desulfurase NifS [Thermanaerovibrio acidaminovorans DSM 6589]|uniref:Cysteine desulfurase IscS n=1 Tax=Thermanaerovibrio acidaminovorans (strain ATCC 49978 / DSM 6589 / Su883) TaxID=525903 RepID=D1B843_THEAS|nr:cysteine desulfurase NifS [Thermanaerovibrio acidaminovorans]ACZ18446.1 cysteine desulfurase NifS [Thermanaerovibrio acidaminovorans DSM 6589]